MKFISNLKIRTKLAILLLVFGLIPLAAISPIVANELDKMRDAKLHEMQATTENLSDAIDRNLFERYGDVQAFTLNSAVKNPANWRNQSDTNTLVSAMNGYMTNYGLYKLMMLVNTDGQLLAINSKDASGKALSTAALYDHSFKDESWFQKTMKQEFLKGKTLTGTVVEDAHYNSIVGTIYNEDGFVITFAAPVYDEHGKIMAIWVNFADFGLIEDIVKSVYAQKKAAGMGYAAFGIQNSEGIALVNFDPADVKDGQEYKRDSSSIGKKSLESLQVPASAKSLTVDSGTTIEVDTQSGESDAVGFSKSKGAYDYPGLGWVIINHTPADETFADINEAKQLLLIVGAATVLAVIIIGSVIGTLASRPLRKSAASMLAIAKGDYTTKVDGADSNDEMGEMAKAMEQLKGTLDTNTRVKQALDSVNSNIMMADENYDIIYMNGSLQNFLKEAERDIQKDLPRFSVSNLIGSNIDVFHKNPSHQRNMLERMNTTTKTSIQVGGRSFNLLAVPLFDQNKKRIGTAVEWQDGAAAGMVDAINRSQAVIEFLPDGTIVHANQNFLSVMGYTLDEIKGNHHSMFADQAYRASAEYRKFWDDLNRGEAQTGEFKRFGKNGKEVWINASYNPIKDLKGKVVRVVKTASDITQMVTTRTENEIGMNEAVKVLREVAAGNLTIKMEYNYIGTFADIKNALNATVDKLTDTVIQIKDSSEAVGNAAAEISAGSTDLSSRTEQQASNLEETAASMEELTATVRQNTENSDTASKQASSARSIAEKGGDVVSRAVAAMRNIEQSSQKISDIIGVIDEIAFQTNLLALNAAVEAARAGEAGKGFAVVASEVRSLAGRSASASKEIKQLISESGHEVKAGAQLVNEAGETLKEIVRSVKDVADIMQEIASASAQQSSGIDEINSAVSQMDEMTQQNAALVEENTAAAQSMSQQAVQLQELMRFFNVNEDGDNAIAASPRPLALAAPTAPAKPATPVKKPLQSKPAQFKKPAPKPTVTASKKSEDGWEEF